MRGADAGNRGIVSGSALFSDALSEGRIIVRRELYGCVIFLRRIDRRDDL